MLLAINSIFSALTCIPIFLIAKRSFGESVAVWSAWLWALAPFVMYWCTRWVWETSLATLLLTLIFWLALVLEDRDGWTPWLAFGLLWSVAALTNTSLLAFLPASGLWAWIRRSKRGRRSFAGVLLASAVFVASIAPWIARDYRRFGQFIFIRSNFGAELRIGNGPNADGTWQQYLHPTQDVYEMRRYRQMGEMAYVAARKQEAMAFIRHHYPQFLGVSGKRFIYYWAGVPRLAEIPALAPFKNSVFLASSVLALWGLGRALRKRQPGAWLFFWLILCYPAMYYFVFPHPRYRHPIEPELGMLIVYIISEAESQGHAEGPRRHPRGDVLRFRFDFHDVNGLLVRLQAAHNLDFLAGKSLSQTLVVEAVDDILMRQNEIAAVVFDAIEGAIGRVATHGLGLQHLLGATGSRNGR